MIYTITTRNKTLSTSVYPRRDDARTALGQIIRLVAKAGSERAATKAAMNGGFTAMNGVTVRYEAHVGITAKKKEATT